MNRMDYLIIKTFNSDNIIYVSGLARFYSIVVYKRMCQYIVENSNFVATIFVVDLDNYDYFVGLLVDGLFLDL
ncbi:hypothetical protein Glove_59g3 [Diversispora epigaea]|uniref:Uncharacterized protein n=1 Tax=Diversispora epigaea TaxID=1348612 RepID=A0A397JFD0_9GLOM|nr:hypothetical protein Glove_59g3 [Diversispora epigaea]